MKLIIGLGNPGEKYLHNRHNLGFLVLEQLARKTESGSVKWEENKKFKAEILKTKFAKEEVILAKPLTFMNNSGWAVEKILRYYDIKLNDLWVIHDDLDLKPGQIKIRKGGGAAGHHGLESIIEHIETNDFVRFRLGIGKPTEDNHRKIEDYVLKDFSSKERDEADRMIKKVLEALESALSENLEKAMNKFNLK